MMKEESSNISLVFNDQPVETDEGIRFQFDAYANSLSKLIASRKTKTPLTIGINGEWGSGKTTLMKAIKRRLDFTNEGRDGYQKFLRAQGLESIEFSKYFRQCRTIWFNAWKYSKEEHLFSALIQEILKQMKKEGFITRLYAELNDPNQPEVKVPEALISTLSQLFSFGTIDLDYTRFESDSKFKSNIAFYDEFQTFFDRLLTWYVSGEKNLNPASNSDEQGVLAIFIDDLDRCLPEKSMQVLETIKLFMDKPRTVFVIGADLTLTASAIEAHYKSGGIQGLKSHDYLEKIIQIRFDLPPINKSEMRSFIEELPDVDQELRGTLDVIVGGLKTNPRKIKTFINHTELQWAILANAKLHTKINKNDLIEWSALRFVAPQFVEHILSLEKHDEKIQIIKQMQAYAKAKLRQAKLVLDKTSGYVSLGGKYVEGLSETEFQVLNFLMENKGKIISKDQLYKINNPNFSSDRNSPGHMSPVEYEGLIDTMLWRLRNKIEPDPREPIFIKTVRGRGVRFEEPLEEIVTPDLNPALRQFENDDILLRVLSRGNYNFTAENIGLYIHLSLSQKGE